MSPIETQDILSEDITPTNEIDNARLVPVAESIRYRKRAQSAEKKIEELTEQLTQAKSQTAELSEQLSDIQTEQKLMRQLAAAGAVDLETAVLIARARIQDQDNADVTGVIEQLKREKQFLSTAGSPGQAPTKTAGGVCAKADETSTIIASNTVAFMGALIVSPSIKVEKFYGL